MARNGVVGRVSGETGEVNAADYDREEVVRVYFEDDNDWSYSVNRGFFIRPRAEMAKTVVWDLEKDAEALPGLTYPFKVGQRVVMRDGQIVTIKRIKTNGLVDTSVGTSTVYDTTDYGHGRGFSTDQESDYDFIRDALDDEED